MKLYNKRCFLNMCTAFAVLQTTLCCVLIKLDEGLIKGRIARIPNSEKTFYAFQQIPYAEPPVGNLRFQPPQAVKKWNGILDTTWGSKMCYQTSSDSEKETEDCLYLNVYTPRLFREKANLLPVMVYFHGGGFIIGSALYEAYGPEFLVNEDVIVVTLNYRLGVFGFLSTQDDIVPGNNGLKDQLLALQWVNKNIHLFGGDNSKITIFGQSAGAASVGYHLLSPKSTGLYKAAIMESSCALSPFGYQRNAKFYANKITNYVYNSTQNYTSEEILQNLKNAAARDLDAAQKIIGDEETYDNVQLFQGYYFAPVIEIESENAFITEKMYEVVKNGEAAKVPIIIGINSEESISQTTDMDFTKKLMGAYDKDLKALLPFDMNVKTDEDKVGERIREIYSGDELLQNVPSAGIRYMSDTTFTRSVIKYAELQSQFSNVYFYYFAYDGELGNVTAPEVEGIEHVGHNEELSYLWRIRSDIFDNYDLTIFPSNDIVTHNRLIKMWTNFAKTENPTPDSDNLLQNLQWPLFQEASNFSYLEITENLGVKNYPKKDSFDQWVKIYEDFGVEPFDTY